MSLDVYLMAIRPTEVYTCNITHNLGKMAAAAGIYEHLWGPNEIGITKAQQLIAPLEEGLAKLQDDPERFAEFNPKNGWGDHGGLVRFVQTYLGACRENPDAEVTTSR